MSRIKKTTRTVLAMLLSLTVVATFYPVTAFAGTDYEAAYNQAQAATQTAYDNWQNAIADRDAKEIAYNQAKTEASQAAAAVEPAYQEMLKKQRLLDLKTRQVIESMSETDYKNDFSSSNPERYKTQNRIDYIVSSNCQFYNVNSYGATPEKLKALQAHLNSKTSSDNTQWNTPGKYLRANNPNNKWSCPQGFTTSTSGNDDTTSLTLYQKYVYYNQSYNLIMLDLDYINEANQIRQKEGKTSLKIASYVLLQSTVNAPMNIYHHNVYMNINGSTYGQNLAGLWGDVNCYTNGSSKDPYNGWYWGEKSSNGRHYKILMGDSTHTWVTCSKSTTAFDDASFTDTVCSQEFYKASNANITDYTVTEFRSIINNKVNSELNAYESAKTAYERAQTTADSKADDAEGLLYDYADAKTEVSYAKADYDRAVREEQSAYEAYQNWLNSGNNDNSEEPSDPVTPDSGSNTEPTVTNVGDVTGLVVSGYKDGNEYVINVSWNAATNVNAYEVYEKVGSGSYTYKTTTNSRSVQFTTTSASTTFRYQVRGLYKDSNTSVYGNVTTSSPYTTPVAETPSVNLAKVTNVNIAKTGWNGLTNSYNMKITWNGVDGASEYKVFTSINNGNYEYDIYTGTSCTCPVPYNGTIKCKVAAMDSNGNVGPESDVKSLTVDDGSDPGSDPQPENVGPVTGVKATTGDVTVTSCKVTISWEKASNATSYTVYKSTNGKNYTDAQTTSNLNKTYELTPNTDYWFKVRGTNGSVNGQMSNVVHVKTKEYTTPTTEPTTVKPTQPKPPQPTYAKSYVKSFKLTRGKKSFTAKWKKQSKANQKKFAGYQIRYSTKKSMKGSKYVTAKKSAKSKKIKKLKAKKKYYVQARTYTVTGGEKVYSKWTKIKTVKTK